MGLWSAEEIVAYRVFSPPLEILYRVFAVSSAPEDRAYYLAENFLRLGMTDHDLTMRLAYDQGRPAALRFLEEMALAELERRLDLS